MTDVKKIPEVSSRGIDIGEKMTIIGNKMKGAVQDILDKLDRQDTNIEDVKNAVRTGLGALVNFMESVLTGESNSLTQERRKKEEG